MKIVFIILLILVGCNQNGGDNPEITEFPIEQIKDIDYLFAIDKLTVETLDSLDKIYPNSIYLYTMRLKYYANIEDYDRFKEIFQDAERPIYSPVSKNPIMTEIIINYVHTYTLYINILYSLIQREQKYDNKFTYFGITEEAKESIKIDSNETNIWSRLLIVRGYLDYDEPIEAFNALSDVMSISDNPEVYYYSTLYYIRYGDIDDAKY